MEPIEIQKVLNHIETNLKKEISYKEISRMLNASESDMQRSFKMIVGMTISEYIHYRRLTKAALEIKNKDTKILDVALEYGYQTAEGFSKAFKQFHGCTPNEARNINQSIRYFNPVVIKIAKRGGNVIEYEKHIQNKIVDYYNLSDEHGRLTKDNSSQIEYIITLEYLDKILKKNDKIFGARI